MTAALLAGALTLLWALVHALVGGRQVAGPLRRDGTLDETVRTTAWMCWHMVTATLLATAGLFVVGALAARPDLVVSATVVAFAIAVAGIVAPPLLRVGYGTLPQGWLFVPVVVCGHWGLLG